MSTEVQVQTRVPTLDLVGRLRRLIAYRELLINLVRKELRVRYKESVLGFLWSMLNPLLYLAVFYVVFNFFLPNRGVPYFTIFLLSGLLGWTLFSSSLAGGANSIVGNGALLKKVNFPREVLPLATVGASVFHFLLQMLVLLGVLILIGYPFFGENLLLVPVALTVEVLLLAGLVLLVSSVTVYLRDVQHFVELALLAWFWMTPIVYQVAIVFDRLAPKGLFGLYLLNPMAPITLAFQRAFYNRVTPQGIPILLDAPLSWYMARLGLVALVALALFVVGLAVFARAEGNFAEEL
ncbi:MAG: ABC transporter permease [Actinomycetota bacterium]